MAKIKEDTPEKLLKYKAFIKQLENGADLNFNYKAINKSNEWVYKDLNFDMDSKGPSRLIWDPPGATIIYGGSVV